MDHFRILLENACENIKQSFGSIDIVKTEGVKILEQEGQQWIEFGASSLYELCPGAEEIKSMISNYNNYDDLKEQFIYDILAILEDLVYHISIFNIYFISALRFLGKRDKMDSGIIQDGFANYLKTVDVDNISYTWKIDISKERKRQLSFIYVSWCFLSVSFAIE